MMAKVAAELHSVILSAAAEAPPLVIHVDDSETSNPHGPCMGIPDAFQAALHSRLGCPISPIKTNRIQAGCLWTSMTDIKD